MNIDASRWKKMPLKPIRFSVGVVSTQFSGDGLQRISGLGPPTVDISMCGVQARATSSRLARAPSAPALTMSTCAFFLARATRVAKSTRDSAWASVVDKVVAKVVRKAIATRMWGKTVMRISPNSNDPS